MTSFIRILFIVTGFSLAVIAASVPYIKHISAVERKAQVIINEQVIIADVVSKPDKIEKGLSGREVLNLNEGMLFIFRDKVLTPFWMKGVTFPLDIIWIADERIVGIVERAEPEIGITTDELTLYFPPRPVDQVLEISAGRARLLNARVGNQVIIKPIVPKGLF